MLTGCFEPGQSNEHLHFYEWFKLWRLLWRLEMGKRAVVSLLLRVAALYAVALWVKRDAPNAQVQHDFRKVCKKSHLDRGGHHQNFKTEPTL